MTNRQGLDASSGAVETLIERFGGLRPMADKLGVPVSTVQGWKKRGVIPANRQDEVRAAAAKHGISDLEATLEGVFRTDDKHSDAPHEDDGAPAPIPEAKAASVKAPEVKAAAERVGEGEAVSDPVVAVTPAEPAPAEREPTEPAPTEPAPAEPAPSAVAKDEPIENVAAASASDGETGKPPAAMSRRDTLMVESAASAAKENGTPEEVDVTEASSAAAGKNDVQARAQSGSDASGSETSGQGTGAAIAAAVLAVIGAAVSVTAPLWSHDYLQRQVNVALIESRTTNFEAALKTGATERTALGARMTELETALSALEAKVAKGPAIAMVLAVRELNTALASGAPFMNELTAVRAAGLLTAADAKALTALLPYASAGVPSREAIGRNFALVAPAAVGSGVTAMLTTDLPTRVWNWVTGVAGSVTVPTVSMPAISMPEMPDMPRMTMPEMPSMPSMADIGAALRLGDGSASATDAAPPAAEPPVAATPVPAAEAPAPVVAAPAAPAEAPAATPPAATAPASVPAAQASVAEAPSSPSTTALLAEAGGLLGSGDLGGAVTTLKALEGPAAKAVSGWVADAEARLAADDLAAALTGRVQAALN